MTCSVRVKHTCEMSTVSRSVCQISAQTLFFFPHLWQSRCSLIKTVPPVLCVYDPSNWQTLSSEVTVRITNQRKKMTRKWAVLFLVFFQGQLIQDEELTCLLSTSQTTFITQTLEWWHHKWMLVKTNIHMKRAFLFFFFLCHHWKVTSDHFSAPS